jgi:tetratricopeptide (TPR) repeat protein
MSSARIHFVTICGAMLCSIFVAGQTTASFQDYVKKADEAAARNRLDQAVPLYRHALRIKPTWKEGWWKVGTSLYDQDHYQQASEAFVHLVALDPKNGAAHLFLGLCQYELKDDGHALANLESARKLGIPDDPKLRTVMLYHEGLLLLRRAAFESALDALNRVTREQPQSAELQMALGMAMLRLRPQDLPAEGSPEREVVRQIGHAQELAATKNFEDAKQAYSTVVRENDRFANIHYAYGRFLLDLHDVEAAVAEFQREIENQPEHVMARLQIAAARYRTDSAAGVPYAEEAVKLNPKLPFGHYVLGLLYVDTGEAAKAVPELEAAERAFPRDPAIYFALGAAYAKLGRKEDAARARAVFTRLNAAKQDNGASSYGERSVGLAPPGA